MRLHPNAKLVPAQRFLLVRRIRREGWRVTQAANAAGVSRQTAHKWLRRYEAKGEAGLRLAAGPGRPRGGRCRLPKPGQAETSPSRIA